MKKIICLMLATLLVLCFAACDTSSEDPKPTEAPRELTVTELLDLIEKNDANNNTGRVMKNSMDASVKATIPGLTMNLTMSMLQYSKEDGDNSVMASEFITTFPGEEAEKDIEYYANGYLYTVIDGVTIKTESSFEEATGSSDNDAEEPSDEEFINVIKESSSEIQSDGSYKVFISIDTTKDISFLYELLGGLDSDGGEINISKMDIMLYVSAEYLVDLVEIDLVVSIVQDNPDVGSIKMEYTMKVKMEIMPQDFVIQIPEDIDIENAVDSSQEEL